MPMKRKPKKDENWHSWRILDEWILPDWHIFKEEQIVSHNEKEIKLKANFWKHLKKIREERWFSQEVLAFKAKLHRTYISDVERGKKNISLENIGRLAWALKIHLHELMNF